MKKMSIVLIILCSLILVACNKDREDNESKEEMENTLPPIEEEKEEEILEFTFSLTGIGTETEPTHRAIAVNINNHVAARPQSGLSKADVVYEVLAEGQVTRFLAIYQSEFPEKFGPVRSSRDYFIDLANGFGSLYIAHGYSPKAKEMLESGVIDHLNGMRYDGTLFKRSSDRKAPHNSYISYENIQAGAEKEGYDLSGAPSPFEFLSAEDIESLKGEQINSIDVAYSRYNQYNSEYRYDAGLERYTRYSDGQQTVELDSNDPILIDNLVIIETTHEVIDSAGRRAIDLTSGGKALLFQKGLMKEIEWRNENGRVIPFDNGGEAKLVPGKTWISIVPSIEIVTFNE